MQKNKLNVLLILHDLKRHTSREKVLHALIILNNIITTSKEELEFLCNSDGINVITDFLKNDNDLVNICLKILANASKRYEKVRNKLLRNNIFHLLAIKLRNETDVTTSNLILYSALIVLLVQGNAEAQNLIRTSGCLSAMVQILCAILDEADNVEIPCKSTELIIYSIVAASRDPRRAENQAEMGWIVPKVREKLGEGDKGESPRLLCFQVLEFLGRQVPFSNSDQLQVVKCFWLFLKCSLDRDEMNQEIFLKYSGLRVLFSSIQSVAEEEKCRETGDLLPMITGVLIKLKSHKDFLAQASNYCPLMILCNLLKTTNTLVIQQIIVFFDSLTAEFPQVMEIIKSEGILKEIRKAKIISLRSQMAAQFCQNLLDRLEAPAERSPALEHHLHPVEKEFCVVHDVEGHSLSECSANGGSADRTGFSPEEVPFHMRQRRESSQKLRKVIRRKVVHPPKNRDGRILTATLLAGKMREIFRKVLAFFLKRPDGRFIHFFH